MATTTVLLRRRGLLVLRLLPLRLYGYAYGETYGSPATAAKTRGRVLLPLLLLLPL